jgi:uncharacterized protein (DUF2336 family)
MSVPATTLGRLCELAREPASGPRRQLLHELTDPLFAVPPEADAAQRAAALAPLAEEESEAAAFARRARLRRKLNDTLLFRLIRDGETTHAQICFAELADIDYEAAHGVFADPSHELLAMVCKAQSVPRAVFTMIAVLREGEAAAAAPRVAAIAAIYDQIPQESADRAIRFWRLRKSAAPLPPPAPDPAPEHIII